MRRAMSFAGSLLLLMMLSTASSAGPFSTVRAQASPLLVFDEIAWAGTVWSTADEWIELYNPGSQAIELGGWRIEAEDGTPTIVLTGTIAAGGRFLLERTDDETAPPLADQIYKGGLENAGEALALLSPDGDAVDRIEAKGGWPAGETETRRSMQRRDPNLSGTNQGNWRNGPISGAPQNSILDADGDGYGASQNLDWRAGPERPGLEMLDEDCHDQDVSIHPGAAEPLDYVDNNCDGEIDEGNILGALDYSLFFNSDQALWRSGPDEQLVPMEAALLSLINGAQRSLDAALYDLRRDRLRDALIAAQQRGVKVRVVADRSHALDEPRARQSFEALRAAGIPVAVSTSVSYLQHNKFVVADQEAVWTGSANWTDNGFSYNLNNAILLRARHLAIAYTMEFDEMFVAGRFATKKLDDSPKRFVYDDGAVEVRFSPSDHMEDRLDQLLSQAERGLHFAMFFWTSDRLGERVADMAAERDLDIVGVWDAVGAKNSGSEDERLCKAGIPLKVEVFGGKVHHKFGVIDADGPAPVTVVGSYNWTQAGDAKNDENTLVIHGHPPIARAFAAEAERLYNALPDETICSQHSAESGIPACSDGSDNDFDKLIDGADPSCRESNPAACADGRDNDGDGDVDQEDLDCLRAPTPAATATRETGGGGDVAVFLPMLGK
jgi:phosphatidylserine/phosphatidylglycerophosphate/cardiolipin synthase-like enzyme